MTFAPPMPSVAIGTVEASATDLTPGRSSAFGQLEEEAARVLLAVARKARVEAHQQQMIRAVAGAVLTCFTKAAVHERRHHQQHH